MINCISAFQVYYHIDDELTPYCTEVRVPPSKITLGDFKKVLNRSNFKYYCKAIDQEVGGCVFIFVLMINPSFFSEVKVEIHDDYQFLCKSSNGHFELFLLTAEGSSHSEGTSPSFSNQNPSKLVSIFLLSGSL